MYLSIRPVVPGLTLDRCISRHVLEANAKKVPSNRPLPFPSLLPYINHPLISFTRFVHDVRTDKLLLWIATAHQRPPNPRQDGVSEMRSTNLWYHVTYTNYIKKKLRWGLRFSQQWMRNWWSRDMTVDSLPEGSESNPQSGLCTDFYPHKQEPPPMPKLQLSECVAQSPH